MLYLTQYQLNSRKTRSWTKSTKKKLAIETPLSKVETLNFGTVFQRMVREKSTNFVALSTGFLRRAENYQGDRSPTSNSVNILRSSWTMNPPPNLHCSETARCGGRPAGLLWSGRAVGVASGAAAASILDGPPCVPWSRRPTRRRRGRRSRR